MNFLLSFKAYARMRALGMAVFVVSFLMCFCYRNYRGPACSERVCPYGHAFITTPQGDLNFDGDRADNLEEIVSGSSNV